MRHNSLDRRQFLELVAALGFTGTSRTASASSAVGSTPPSGSYHPGRIPNEYSLFFPGEEISLKTTPTVKRIENGALTANVAGRSVTMRPGDQIDGWYLLGIFSIEKESTAVFEKSVSHRGAMVYVTERKGLYGYIPRQIGQLANIRPRPTNTPHGVRLTRVAHFEPGTPDRPGLYILNSVEDPSYENVAALGAEYVGWTLVANEEAGPEASLYLDAAGRSRQLVSLVDLAPTLGVRNSQSGDKTKWWRVWAPDAGYPLFDPLVNPAVGAVAPQVCSAQQIYAYVDGYSKRTLLGGYMPVADIGVWNPIHRAGYQVTLLLPSGKSAKPMARLRHLIPEELPSPPSQPNDPPKQEANSDELARAAVSIRDGGTTYVDSYWNGTAEEFYAALHGIWDRWHSFHEQSMQVDIPDEWLRNAAQAGLTLTRCSYRGLEPTYQVGEGAYTKFHTPPDCAVQSPCEEIAYSDAIFPVAHYEFVWAHQLWNHVDDADTYFQYYLDHYVLPNGDFLYNTTGGEAPLNVGIFLANSARSYFYGRSLVAFEKRLPILERMIGWVLRRYEYSKAHFAVGDRRRGLIWGTPEADLTGDGDQAPDNHPYYYQNAAWIWRGLVQHAQSLEQASRDGQHNDFSVLAARYREIAHEMRGLIGASIAATRALGNTEMRSAGITPFSPSDIDRKVTDLANYENHRFMEDWFLLDWGDPQLDLGHLKHRELSGRQLLGLGLGHGPSNTSNFMAHGTLSVLIRQDDYRPFLLALYALTCFAADSGNRYSPEDAFIPGGRPLEGDPNFWSAVVNSALQPTLGLRWLLCYEETDRDVCHLQKATPKHWFSDGQSISVKNCLTRFGLISWSTRTIGAGRWEITVDVPKGFSGDLVVHIHPNDDRPLRSTSLGTLEGNKIVLLKDSLWTATQLKIVASG